MRYCTVANGMPEGTSGRRVGFKRFRSVERDAPLIWYGLSSVVMAESAGLGDR